MQGHGMVLAPDEAGLRVHDILADTPAAAADIQPGDIITHFNDQPLLDRDCQALRSDTVQVTLTRNGVLQKVELTLFPLVP